MSEFYRIQQYNSDCDEADFLNVIGMIVSEIKCNSSGNQRLEWSFDIIQDESSGLIEVKYFSTCTEENLKLAKLVNSSGTLVYMNNCVRTPYGLTLEIWDEMAIVAFRPNTFQVNKFLKDRIITFH